MKKPNSHKRNGELRPEYGPEFFRRLHPNRFASRMKGQVVAVVLDPDVAEVFDSSEAVNRFLRSAIVAMRKRRPRKTVRKKRAV